MTDRVVVQAHVARWGSGTEQHGNVCCERARRPGGNGGVVVVVCAAR